MANQVTLFESSWEQGGTKWCVQSLAAWCRFAPCTYVQGVDCCGSCPFVRSCNTPCEAFRKWEP